MVWMTAAAKLINGDMVHCRQTEKNKKEQIVFHMITIYQQTKESIKQQN